MTVRKPGPVAVVLPAQPEHERLRLEMHQCVERAAGSLIDFAERAAQFIAKGYYARYGCEDARTYFAQQGPVSWRTCQKALAVWEGLCRLPEPERPAARKALAAIGSHKASILAPLLGETGQDWRKWIDFAEGATEEAVQEAVSAARGAQPRGAAAPPEERLARLILANLPEEARPEVEQVFEGMYQIMGSRNSYAAVIYIFAHMKDEVLLRAEQFR